MKNKRALEINRRANFRASSEKFNFTKHLVGFWRYLERDLEDNLHWKYDELSPLPLLEKLKLAECPADKDELARAEFFWSRRATLASCRRLYCLAYCGSRPAILAIHRSGHRTAASNNIGGGSEHRDRTICAVATSV